MAIPFINSMEKGNVVNIASLLVGVACARAIVLNEWIVVICLVLAILILSKV